MTACFPDAFGFWMWVEGEAVLLYNALIWPPKRGARIALLNRTSVM